ncbi:MAG: pyridoxamine 5'-phosphate oxidase family protein [Microthrixaceae bacterium]
MARMATWGEFARLRPDLAAGGRTLLYQHGVGLAFLATIRKDSGPRVHPMCPLLTDEAMFAFIIPSPKQQDLRRDGRLAMHSFPCPDNEDAFYLAGRAAVVEDRALRETLGQQFVDERSQFGAAFPADADVLFEFEIERCLFTKTTGHGDPNAQHEVWHAPTNA